MTYYPPITIENYGQLSRRVRRAFHRAYLKLNGVPKPNYLPTVAERRKFKRLNLLTMIKDMHDKREDVLPKMDVRGEAL